MSFILDDTEVNRSVFGHVPSPLSQQPLEPSEHKMALHLWDAVFNEPPGFFEKYYAKDPDYRPGDTLSVWDGDRLVSAIHICRRTLSFDGRRLLCGGIANVATLPEYRGRKIAAGLLTAAIDKMTAEGFAFSLLGAASEAMPLYARLGWQPLAIPSASVTLSPDLPRSGIEPQPAQVTPEVMALWETVQRPLQLIRPPNYFTGWPQWNGGHIFLLPDRGYLLLKMPTEPDGQAHAEEWCAAEADTEHALLASAAAWAQSQSCSRLALAALPQFDGFDALSSLGNPSQSTDDHTMLHPLTLSEAESQTLKDLYTSGQAVWWPSDAF